MSSQFLQSLPDDIIFYIAEFIIPASYVKQLRKKTAKDLAKDLSTKSNYTNSSIPISVFRENMAELTLAYLKLCPRDTCRLRELYIQPKLLYMLTYLLDPYIELPPFQEIEVKKEKEYYIRHIMNTIQYYHNRRQLSPQATHSLLMTNNLEKEIKNKENYYQFLIHSILM
jgi:hypothetical protein